MNESAAHIQTSISQKWIQAAAFGSIWPAIEIVAGSFLHNIRPPSQASCFNATKS